MMMMMMMMMMMIMQAGRQADRQLRCIASPHIALASITSPPIRHLIILGNSIYRSMEILRSGK